MSFQSFLGSEPKGLVPAVFELPIHELSIRQSDKRRSRQRSFLRTDAGLLDDVTLQISTSALRNAPTLSGASGRLS